MSTCLVGVGIKWDNVPKTLSTVPDPRRGSISACPVITFSPCVLVSLDCHKKILQPGWLKQQIFIFSVLEAGSTRSRC